MLGKYANDNEGHVLVVTESNVTEKDLEGAKMGKFTLTNHSCRQEKGIKGGGGGGALIYVHQHVPYVEGANQVTSEKGVLEYCATKIYPNYTYSQCLAITGVYRQPDSKHPEYETSLRAILALNQSENTSTIIAGDVNINTWRKEYEYWLWREELWEYAHA